VSSVTERDTAAGDPADDPDPEPDRPAPVPLTEPRDGVPDPLTTARELADAVDRLRAGSALGLPLAVDAERASGYRYGQRAYLVQLRRADVGTLLIDPAALPDLHALGEVIADDEWVLHAASQDLPCLAELGLRPTRLFDTELAGRLLGYARVGLGAIVEEVLGLTLEKGHSAADWSTRPLPEPWLRYAALDVEVLVELRDHLADELDRTGKRA
jgi:ribonuclease D